MSFKVHSLWLLCVVCASPALAEPTLYKLASPVSEIRFTVDAPLDSIPGRSRALKGEAHWDSVSGVGSGQFVVDLATFQTGIALRDRDLREEFFEVAQYPAATLTVERFVAQSLPQEGTAGRLEAFGKLALHGVERPVRFPVRVVSSALNGRNVLSVSGGFEVAFADYRIKRPTALFLKLGKRAEVNLSAVLLEVPGAAVPAGAPVAEADLSLLSIPIKADTLVVAKLPKQQIEHVHSAFLFAANTARGRGERLAHSPHLGGKGNGMSCVSCHSVSDERVGMVSRGNILPNRSLFDAAKRPALWQGLAPTPGKASSICAKLFMLRPEGLSGKQEAELTAFIKAISPDDAVAPLDYRVLALTRRAELPHPLSGNAHRGVALEAKFCGDCHAAGNMRPPLTRGLYEPEYLVQRVRWLPGHDARQMPPFYVDRLTDSDLRDIVTYLTGGETRKIFDRPKLSAANTSALGNGT